MIAVPNGVDVSRETLDDLTVFHDLIQKWSPVINLISRRDLPDVWQRHIWDSAQIWPLVRNQARWADFGTGGGFPAIVCAILAKEDAPLTEFVCVESDQRKCEFLRTAVRTLSLNVRVMPERAEAVEGLRADVVTARALSSLADVLELVTRHMVPSGRAFLQKGRRWQSELEEARQIWDFEYIAHPSASDPLAAILEIRDLSRV